MKVPSIKELRKITGVKRKGIFYRFHDYLAYFPAKIFLHTPVTANQITISWIIIQFIASLFMSTGDYLTMIIALLVFQFMFVIDCADGVIARYKKQFSLNGIYFDHMGHYINNPALLLSLSIGVYRIQANRIYLLFGLVAAGSFLLNKALTQSSLWYKSQNQREKIEESLDKSALHKKGTVLYFFFELFRMEYLFNLMFWGVLLGYAHYALILYSIFLFLELVRKISAQIINNYKLDK